MYIMASITSSHFVLSPKYIFQNGIGELPSILKVKLCCLWQWSIVTLCIDYIDRTSGNSYTGTHQSWHQGTLTLEHTSPDIRELWHWNTPVLTSGNSYAGTHQSWNQGTLTLEHTSPEIRELLHWNTGDIALSSQVSRSEWKINILLRILAKITW